MIGSSKLFDCITFYDENLITNARFEILNDIVDYFIVCESTYDHSGKKKKLNFKLLNKTFKSKVRHLVIDKKLSKSNNRWEAEETQREFIFNGIKDAKDEDYIMYSDSDEIPNPKKLNNLVLKKKYGIFLQKFFVYKLNIFNKFETPWEGTRITRKKNINKINFLRKKIQSSNLKKNFLKFYYDRSIQLFDDGGWHFNNLYSYKVISKKLKAFPHIEYSGNHYTNLKFIKNKVENLEDLFGRNHKYEKINIDHRYPVYILKNLDIFKEFILV